MILSEYFVLMSDVREPRDDATTMNVPVSPFWNIIKFQSLSVFDKIVKQSKPYPRTVFRDDLYVLKKAK